MLQTHYSSTLDFSNEALQAAEKGFQRLMAAGRQLEKLRASESSSVNIAALHDACYAAMNDDFNSPILLAQLFEAVRIINTVADARETISAADLELLRKLYSDFVFDVLGLKDDIGDNSNGGTTDGLMQLIIKMRAEARAKKDFATSDLVRDELAKLNIVLKDGKEGTGWDIKA
jgi:cysteinyl-tRNA synthetase